MTEETKTEEKQEEEAPTPTFLEEVKVLRDELKGQIAELKELRAVEVLSGRADVAKPEEKPKEPTPEEYAKAAQKGIILGKE